MIVRGLSDGQVLSEVFRIGQQSLGDDCWMLATRVRGDAWKEPAGRRRYKIAPKSVLTGGTLCDTVCDV